MASSHLNLLVLTAALVLAASHVAVAQTAVSPPGRLLASNCFQCHGTNGNGPGFDKLAGKSARKLFEEMKEYQSDKKDKGIMARHPWATATPNCTNSANGFRSSNVDGVESWIDVSFSALRRVWPRFLPVA